MSKVVRERLQQTMKCMEEATLIIGMRCADGFADLGQGDTLLMSLLTDTQDLAIAFGTRIEKLKGLHTKTVAELESYCEGLFRISECTEKTQQQKIVASLEMQMQQIKTAFETDFPDKKEVVFLPYKASMWDSLESVWKAAEADSKCEAYVIPIPYYTRDSQKNFKEFYYEGDQYPNYVPITDYREYDLELHHPDIIYVHNPYDEYNLVTSIAPEFYLQKIKDYTEKLVYIPYFVLQEIDPANQAAIDSMKAFCYLPGTICADQVILQSEDMRQIYINEYMKAAKERNVKVERSELEKRFLGIGSPKFDKVINTRKEDVDIPKDWLRIIRKPDGTYKKVIFYNTSVVALQLNREKMLDKMRFVLQIFKDRKDEVALLWRPHPLIKDTIQEMLPNLWEEYQKLEQQYKEEGWGIYDDTADLDRAIALSDAYYGDGSSVVQLCQKAGLPVMIQNVDILEA